MKFIQNMASKDVKTILKEAREAIKNKSYSIAITKCNVRHVISQKYKSAINFTLI